MSSKVFLGLGSNLNDRMANLKQAINYLEEFELLIENISSVYETKALSDMDQPNYYNLVAVVHTNLTAHNLLLLLQGIEDKMQRDRTVPRWSARIIDIDIILYADQIIDTENLVVPHYGMRDRSFVLFPLLEIKQDILLPSGERVADIWSATGFAVPKKIGEI
jgi:2-amino-4-hydroxy-6-hydroxymethyldihydropteridine diphosphokinase